MNHSCLIWAKIVTGVVLWLAASLLAGFVLSLLFPPTAIVYSMAIFGAPVLFFGLLLGFQDGPTVEVKRVTFLRMPIYDRRTLYRQKTFWGLKYGNQELVAQETHILPEPEALGLPFSYELLPRVVRVLLPR